MYSLVLYIYVFRFMEKLRTEGSGGAVGVRARDSEVEMEGSVEG